MPMIEGLMARHRALAALLALLAGLALLASGCGGSGTTVAAPTTLGALADSARRSADASSGRFTFSVNMTIPPLPGSLGFTGEGAFDAAVDKTEMSLDLSSFLKLMEGLAGSLGGSGVDTGLDPDDFKLDAVTDGLVMYMRFPFLADKLPEGKDWVKIDLRRAASQVPGLDLDQFLQFANNGPQSTLTYLKAVSGPIETVGVDELRGVSTTHYRTNVDVAKYATLVPEAQREQLSSMLDQLVKQTGLRTIPVDVWVGEDGLVRKLEMAMTMTEPGTSQTAAASMSYEMFDYGEPVHITLPLPTETVDVTALASR
jgi:hypothetical protein